jgi:hypothetical protein
MRKIVLAYSLIICVSLMSVSSVNFFVTDAYAIPNSDVPAPDGHPHSCGIPGHPQFIDGTVTWENGSGIWVGGNLTNPDDTCHQHHCNQGFDNPPNYDANAVWDNTQLRVDWVGTFDRGHGFINEWVEAGGGAACIPRYRFVPGDGHVSVGDLRLTAVPPFAAGTVVVAGDGDICSKLIDFVSLRSIEGKTVRPEKHAENIGANSQYDPGEFIYRDNDNDGMVSVGDLRLTAVGAFPAGSVVAAGNGDIGTPLTLFQPNEKHRENVAVNDLYDPGEFIYRDNDTWPAINPAGNDPRTRIRQAFSMWSSIDSDVPHLAVGLEFIEVTDGEAEIYIHWGDITPLGSTSYWGNDIPNAVPVEMTFDSNPDDPATPAVETWEFGPPAAVGPNEYHFPYTALHETGHVVGLQDLPRPPVGPPTENMHTPLDAGEGLAALTPGSLHGARDLYSIPAPDFGDAEPWIYPVLKANNGARNLFIGREWLGKNPIGQTTTTWEWDARIVDLDVPDDGCFFRLPAPGVGGIGFAFVTVSVTDWQSLRYNNTFGYELYLAIWIDWDWLGGWNHPAEMVVFDRLRPSTWGGNTWSWVYNFTVPNGWRAPTWGRARLVYANTGMNLFPLGLIPDFQSPDNGGEVEDYFLPMHAGDFNGDGTVDGSDFFILLINWGKTYP